MTKEPNYLGNGSTFLKYICFLIAGKVIMLAIAHDIHLPVDQYTLAEIIGYLLGFIGATIDAKYPNNLNWQYLKKIFNKEIDSDR